MYAFHFAGEVVSIPLPYAVSSIWPLPFGLLLQKSTDGGRMVSSSSSLLNARDLNRPNKEYGLTYNVSCQANTMETDSKANGAIISSHLILKHPLEEPQVYIVQHHLHFCLVVVAYLFGFSNTWSMVKWLTSLQVHCWYTISVTGCAMLFEHFSRAPAWCCVDLINKYLFTGNIFWRKGKTNYDERFWWKDNLDKWYYTSNGFIS